jgi:hypothetical protein
MKTVDGVSSVSSAGAQREQLAQADVRPVEQDWGFLLSLLPPQWDQWAHETGALQRRRGVPDAAAFLRLIFAYGYCGLSLRLTVFWAALKGIASLSEVALLQRLRRARPWMGRLLAAKLAAHGPVPPERAAGLHVRLVDATVASRPGSTGTDWKIHLGFDLATLTVTQVALTGAEGGETFKRLPVEPGTITVGDRGYAQRQGIAIVDAAGGWVVVRLNWRTVPLEHPEGRAFDLFAALRTLAPGQVGAWPVRTAPAADGTPPVPGRLVALGKSPAATAEARRKVHREARRQGKTPDARSLEAAGYLFLFTTVPATRLTAAEVLELYRFRWQIELAFKRLKSLLQLGALPAKDPELCQTILLTKLLAAVLVDELMHRWVDFSPWGYGPPAPALAVASVSGAGGQPAADDRPRPGGEGVVAGGGAHPRVARHPAPARAPGRARSETIPI